MIYSNAYKCTIVNLDPYILYCALSPFFLSKSLRRSATLWIALYSCSINQGYSRYSNSGLESLYPAISTFC